MECNLLTKSFGSFFQVDLPHIFDNDRTNYGKFNIHFAVLADWNALDENLKQILKNQWMTLGWDLYINNQIIHGSLLGK